MTVDKTAMGSPWAVFQFDMSAGSGNPVLTLYTVVPGTVITCEESDIITGTDTFLQALGLFFIKKLPPGVAPPAKPYLFSTGTHQVGTAPLGSSGTTATYLTQNPETCKLCVLSAQKASTLNSVILPPQTQIVVNTSDFDPTTNSIRANSVFFVNQDLTHPQGPYIFTDHDIPIDILPEEEEEAPNS